MKNKKQVEVGSEVRSTLHGGRAVVLRIGTGLGPNTAEVRWNYGRVDIVILDDLVVEPMPKSDEET
jgi:hypothetical protein